MNKDRLTALIKKISNEKKLSFNSLLTYFFMEMSLKRINQSQFRDQFIIKGGFLLSNMVGVANRTTIDIDISVKGVQIDEKRIRTVFNTIFESKDDNGFRFAVLRMEKIKMGDKYNGLRVILECRLDNIRINIPMDIVAGDPVTPDDIEYEYISIFTGESIRIRSYNIETIIAEKLETIYSKALANSRSKDFYDLFMINTFYTNSLDCIKINEACKQTFHYRQTELDYEKIRQLMEQLQDDPVQRKRWQNFIRKNFYARHLRFEEIMETNIEVVRRIDSVNN